MTDSQPFEPVAPPVALRQAREAAGLHVAALAAALKVPVKKLEALEAGRYEELPDLTFARALASSACRHLRVDPAMVLAQIPQAQRPALGESSQVINAPFKPAEKLVSSSPAGWLSRTALLGAIALLLAALVLVFMPDLGERFSFGSPSTDTPSTVIQETLAPAEEPAGVASAPAEAVAAAPAAAEAVASTPAAAAAESAAPAAAPAPEAAAPGAAILSLRAAGDSWIEVINGSGSVVVQRMLRTGDVLDFSTAPPYAVVLGRADAVKVTVRGQAFDVTPFARNSVARFEVK